MKGKIFPLSIIMAAVLLAPILPVSASLVEIDTTAVVYKVIDGDTFDAFPVGRVRLADIDTPERGEPGYYEAKDFLSLMVYRERVYLDVDDIYVMDAYNRLVCLVYVRYNSTHIINVNLALIAAGLATIRDYSNEFNPYAWTLFIYYPADVLPETYDELLKVYLKLNATYHKLSVKYAELEAAYNKLKADYDGLKVSYGNLESNYDMLKKDYGSLKAIHDALKAEHEAANRELDELRTSINLMYLFMATTIAFMATTVYFARRKPKAA